MDEDVLFLFARQLLHVLLQHAQAEHDTMVQRSVAARRLCCHLQRLDGALASVQEGRSTAEHPVEAALAEVEDLLSYCNDIIGTGALQRLEYHHELVALCML